MELQGMNESFYYPQFMALIITYPVSFFAAGKSSQYILVFPPEQQRVYILHGNETRALGYHANVYKNRSAVMVSLSTLP